MISSLYLSSTRNGLPLRARVFIDGFEQFAVFRTILQNVIDANFARLELVVVHRGEPAATPGAGAGRYLPLLLNAKERKLLPYNAYEEFDRNSKPSPDRLALVDCTDLLGSAPRLEATPLTDRFPAEIIDTIRSYNLHVILRFGFHTLRGDVLKLARYVRSYSGGPPMLWVVVEDNRCSAGTLHALAERPDDGIVPYKSVFGDQSRDVEQLEHGISLLGFQPLRNPPASSTASGWLGCRQEGCHSQLARSRGGGLSYFLLTLCEPAGNATFGALFTPPTLTGEWAFLPVESYLYRCPERARGRCDLHG